MGTRCMLHDPIGSLTVEAHFKHSLCLALRACSDDSLDTPTVRVTIFYITCGRRSDLWPTHEINNGYVLLYSIITMRGYV